jgi:hypothetical protein
MANVGATVKLDGLKQLVGAFNKFDRDLVGDLGNELAEAAAPVRTTTEEYITGGGGGVSSMRGVVGRSEYLSHMRVDFSKRLSTAYVAPQWRSNKGTPQGRVLSGAIRRRMEQAVDDRSSEVEARVGRFLDTLADDWGSHLT